MTTTDVDTVLAAGLGALRRPFDPEAIGKLPRGTCKACRDSPRKRCDQHAWISGCQECRGSHSSATIHIDYVGHADVTDRLLEVDPAWTWAPFTAEDLQGIPPSFRNGLWIHLTVLGVTRPGFGDVTGTGGPKEAIGDALRNAAMRFGVALDLWAKGDRAWASADKHDATQDHPDTAPPPESQPAEYNGPGTADLLTQIDVDAERAGVTYAAATLRLRTDLGKMRGLSEPLAVDALDGVEPHLIAPFAAAVRTHADKVVREAAAAAAAEQTEQRQDDAAEASAKADQNG